MNLLYIVPFWPYLYTPWLYREMAWMSEHGHRLALVSLGDPPGPRAEPADWGLGDMPVLKLCLGHRSDTRTLGGLLGLGITGWFTNSGPSLSQWVQAEGRRQGCASWVGRKRLVRFARRHRIDMIEAHWASSSADMARELSEIEGIPYAVRLHGGDLYRAPSPNLPRIVAGAAVVCPVSAFLRSLLRGERPVEHLPHVPPVELDESRVRICHNGIPAAIIAGEPVPQDEEQQIVATVGRLDPEKRHMDLVEALARLRNRTPGLKLKIIGGGQFEQMLRSRAEAAGIGDRLIITGNLPWQQVIEELRTSSIYAQTSDVEGFGLASLEGLSQGLPGILSRTGAASELIEEGVNGHLFNAGDVSALAELMARLVDAGAAARRQMGSAGLQRVRDSFTCETLMPRLEAILTAARDGIALPE